jgi:23S rRNA maturation-related 3'-5' exoribonuclease YhaM
MTEVQRQATAAGFLHALHKSPEVFKEWTAAKKDDYATLGKLIQKSVGLAETPSVDDIHAMAKHVDANLKDEAAAFHAAHPQAEHLVGSIAFMQQS